jgi:hypothetical protein
MMAGRSISLVSFAGRALKLFGSSFAAADLSRLVSPNRFVRNQHILAGNERHLAELDVAASVAIGMPIFRDGFSRPEFRRETVTTH